MICSLKPDIVALQETKIDGTISSSELFHDNLGYDVFRNDRTLKGGDVLLLVNKVLGASQVSVSNPAESVWVKIKLAGSMHYFASWYRPPDSPSDHINCLNEQMLEIRNNHRTHIPVSLHILGDFNYRAVDWKNKSNRLSGKALSDCEGQLFIDILNEHSAEQLVSFPTRFDNTLDLLVTTSPNQYSNICAQDSLSDHDIIGLFSLSQAALKAT